MLGFKRARLVWDTVRLDGTSLDVVKRSLCLKTPLVTSPSWSSVAQDNPQTLLWAVSCRSYFLSALLRTACVSTALVDTSASGWMYDESRKDTLLLGFFSWFFYWFFACVFWQFARHKWCSINFYYMWEKTDVGTADASQTFCELHNNNLKW